MRAEDVMAFERELRYMRRALGHARVEVIFDETRTEIGVLSTPPGSAGHGGPGGTPAEALDCKSAARSPGDPDLRQGAGGSRL